MPFTGLISDLGLGQAFRGRRRSAPLSGGLLLAVLAVAPAQALDVQTAISKAIAADPRLTAGGLDVEAAHGAVVQAGKHPNPEASIEVENFAGSGDFSGFEASEVTLGVQQKFERGGKRSARLLEAYGKEDVANAQFAILRREVAAQTRIDFVAVLAGMATVDLLARSVKRLEALVPQLEKRLAAGASLKADVARGQLAAGRARVGLEKARSQVRGLKQQLVANWNGSLSDADSISGQLRHNGHRSLPLAELLPLLDRHPAIRAWDAVWAERSGNVSVQHSLAVPDVTVGAGVRRLGESDDVAFVFTGSIPLPIHDRNEGNIITSQAQLDKVRFEREAARRALKRKLIEAHGELQAECLESQKLFDAVVPAGRVAADDIVNTFEQGRLTAKDVLDGYSALLDVEQLQIEADARCHAAEVKVETLVARKPWVNGWEPTATRSKP
jgi:cobalt-zinc-cadmium efflux system outer membrane protein